MASSTINLIRALESFDSTLAKCEAQILAYREEQGLVPKLVRTVVEERPDGWIVVVHLNDGSVVVPAGAKLRDDPFAAFVDEARVRMRRGVPYLWNPLVPRRSPE